MNNRDNTKARYFRRQKIMGGVLALLGVVSAFVLEGDITVALFTVPWGLYIVFTKERVLLDDYYWDHQAIHSDEEKES